MRFVFLTVTTVLILAVIALMIFYLKNEESPHSILIKLFTPMLIGIIWVAATIEEKEREYEEYYGGVVVLNRHNKTPFRILLSNLVEENNNLQKLLPIPLSSTFSTIDEDDIALRIIKGGIWLSFLEHTGTCWEGQKVKVHSFNGRSSSIRCNQQTSDIDIDEILYKLMVRRRDFDDMPNKIGFPKGTKIKDIDNNNFVIETPELTLKISVFVNGMGTISSLGHLPKTDSFEVIKYAEKTHQGNSFEEFTFIFSIERSIKWYYQWSNQTKLQLQWTDQLIKDLRSSIEWDSYQQSFIDELVEKNTQNINYLLGEPEEIIITSNKENIELIKNVLSNILTVTFDSTKNKLTANMTSDSRRSFEFVLKQMGIKYLYKNNLFTIE